MPIQSDAVPADSRRAWRLLGVFAVALALLCALAADRLLQPSKDNHFVHLGRSWLHGTLAHEGLPPGYCDPEARRAKRCRHHTFDDWAAVTTLSFEDGRELRAYPCKTPACAEAKRRGESMWFVLGQGWTSFRSDEIRRASKEVTWYVSFPPGPAAIMLPATAVFGLDTPDVLLTVIAASLIPVLLVGFLDRERGTTGGRGRAHLLLALAWTLGTPACFLAANGRVWFTAQVFGALMLCAYVDAAWRLRRPALAGLWLGLAVACRPTMALAVVLFAGHWWSQGHKPRALAAFIGPLTLIGAVLMWMNLERFGMPFEFGHRFLEIRWQPRMQEIGMFSTEYLWRNLRCMGWLMPQASEVFPYFKVSIHGCALWLTTPWLAAAAWARERTAGRGWLWAAAGLVALPPLLYQNSGQMQFTYRFAVDWLPLVVFGLGLSGAGLRPRRFVPLLALAVALQSYGAYRFSRAPTKLFVVKPMAWPFEDELKPTPARASRSR